MLHGVSVVRTRWRSPGEGSDHWSVKLGGPGGVCGGSCASAELAAGSISSASREASARTRAGRDIVASKYSQSARRGQRTRKVGRPW